MLLSEHSELWNISVGSSTEAPQGMPKLHRSVPSSVSRAAGGFLLLFPVLSRETVSELEQVPECFYVTSRRFSFNAFNSVCFPFPWGDLTEEG